MAADNTSARKRSWPTSRPRKWVNRPLKERFMEKFVRIPWSGCWIWMGASNSRSKPDSKKIPLIHVNELGKGDRAHRVSYSLFVGPIPKGMQVCHTCDVPLCVNPEHLFLGTVHDNQRDKVRKNRHTKGETHGCSKLKNADVLAIRASADGARVLAERFACSMSLVYQIRAGTIWRHLL